MWYSAGAVASGGAKARARFRRTLLAADTLVGAASDYLHGDALEYGPGNWTCGHSSDYVRVGDDTGMMQGRYAYYKAANFDIGVLSHRVQVDVRYDAVLNQSNRYGGVCFRGKSQADHLFFVPYSPEGNTNWLLGSRVGSSIVSLLGGYATGPTLNDGQWYTVTIEAVGNMITAYVDDVLVAEHELIDTDVTNYGVSSSATLVGVYSSGYGANTQRLRNFKCWRTYGGQ